MTVNEHKFLSDVEVGALSFYDGGSFFYLTQCRFKPQYEFELNKCGDPTLIFIMQTLSPENGCNSVDEAKHRIAQISKKIFEVQRALYESSKLTVPA